MNVRLLPSELDGLLGIGVSLSIPVFVLFLSGVIFGLFVGFVWEWIRDCLLYTSDAADDQ